MHSCSSSNRYCLICQTPLSSLQISQHQKFCSKTCKGKSQRKIICITCPNCKKEFFILPYLQRATNYCSVKCYLDATRKKHKKICKICGKEFSIKDYLVKQGFGIYCSRKCQFTDYENHRVSLVCKSCRKTFFEPISVGKRKIFCSKECADNYKRDYVARICKNCHKEFSLPRWELNKGKGTFCSRNCYIKFNGETSIEEKIRKGLENRKIDFQQEVKIGKYYLDFLIPNKNIVIECDGEYWHGLSRAKIRDKNKDKFLKSKGYLIYRFGEKEIKNSAEDCLSKINLL